MRILTIISELWRNRLCDQVSAPPPLRCRQRQTLSTSIHRPPIFKLSTSVSVRELLRRALRTPRDELLGFGSKAFGVAPHDFRGEWFCSGRQNQRSIYRERAGYVGNSAASLMRMLRAACGVVLLASSANGQLPAPRVELSFSESAGTITANSGSRGGTASFVQGNTLPLFTTAIPGGAFAPMAMPEQSISE